MTKQTRGVAPYTHSPEAKAIQSLLSSNNLPLAKKALIDELTGIMDECDTNVQVYTKLGVSRETWYRWRQTIPEIQKLYKQWQKRVAAQAAEAEAT